MLRNNVLANLAGRVWGLVSVYFFAPIYLHYLGPDAYGLVGFYSTLLGVIAFTDIGLTATLSREMARLSTVPGGESGKQNLLRTYEIIYLFLSIFIFLAVFTVSPWIARYWLKATVISVSDVTVALRWMGLAIALQMPAGLFLGGLMGLQMQVFSNMLQIVWGMFRGFGAVALLQFVSNDIVMFSVSQVACNLAYCLLARGYLWKSIKVTPNIARFDLQTLRSTWKYASGMALATLLSVVLTQEDKVILSKLESLSNFGYYSLAGSLAAIPLSLAGPIGSAFFPQLTSLHSLGKLDELKKIYHRGCQLISVAIFPLVVVIAFFSRPLIVAWTGSPEIASVAGTATTLLVIGQGLQAVTVMPYYTLLSFGKLRLNIALSIASIVIITPVLYFLILLRGMEGAGISWLLMNLATLPFYMYIMHRTILPGEFKIWLVLDFLRPLVPALLVAGACNFLLPSPVSRFDTIAFAGIAWLSATIASCLAIPDYRLKIFRFKRRPR